MSILVGVGCYVCGVFTTLLIGWRVYGRLVERLNARHGLLTTIRDLENRRVAYDSGRSHLARQDGGRQAAESDGMATKPGSLAKYHQSHS